MPFSLAALSAAVSLAMNGLSYAKSIKNNKEQKAESDKHYAEQQAHYAAMENQNLADSVSGRATLAAYDREADHQREIAENKANVLGLTEEYPLGVAKANASGRAEVMTGLAKEQTAQNIAAGDKLQQSKSAQFADNTAFRANQQQQLGNAIQNTTNSVSSIISAASTAGAGTSPSTGAKKLATGTAVAGSTAGQSLSQKMNTWMQGNDYQYYLQNIRGGR